jgi:hypothetical protein
MAADPKAFLRRYLQQARDAVVWKLDGLSDYLPDGGISWQDHWSRVEQAARAAR